MHDYNSRFSCELIVNILETLRVWIFLAKQDRNEIKG